MPPSRIPELQPVLDGMIQGVLIFAPDGRLVSENRSARAVLAADLVVIRESGFGAAAFLLNQQLPDDALKLEEARQQALNGGKPVRMRAIRAGETQPVVVSVIEGPDGLLYTMLVFETTDWAPLNEALGNFGQELSNSVESARGHADLIQQVIDRLKPEEDAATLAKRITGFNRIIHTHMIRADRLLVMLERLTAVRTGTLRDQIRARRKRVDLPLLIEDLLEEINQVAIVDPDTDYGDVRSRIHVSVVDDLRAECSPVHLTRILQDILANAIMYSTPETAIHLVAQRKLAAVQIDVIDDGIGIRESEQDRVFAPFRRARQPQVISEFGYGLSLYLCKQEVEAMNGRIWFDSVENAGTTFSIVLPAAGSSSAKSEA